MQASQDAPSLGEEYATGSVAVDAMSELETSNIRTEHPQGFDECDPDTASPMDGEPGRLVDHEKRIVFVQDRRLERFRERGTDARCLRRRKRVDRGQTNLVTDRETVAGFYPAPADPNFTPAQHAVDATPGNTAQLSQQKIVDALPRIVLSDLHIAHA